MKLFETVQPWKTESDKLRSKSKIQGEDLHRLQLQLSNTTEVCSKIGFANIHFMKKGNLWYDF